MILQAQDIVKDALGLIGATAIDETPSASDISVGLRTLNVMIDSWSAKHLMLRSTSTDVFSLVAGTYLYTIGPSVTPPNFVTAKPIRVLSAYIRDASNTDDALEIITLEQYNSYSDKALSSGRPTTLMYDPGVTQQSPNAGTIAIYNIPDQNYTLTIESDKYLTEFVLSTDTVTLEPAYYEALIYGLAVRLYRRYHEHDKPIPVDIVATSREAMRIIETMNSSLIKSSMDLPGKVISFNIYNDQYYGN